MPRFRVMTREAVYRVHIVEAADLEAAWDAEVDPEDGKIVDNEFEFAMVEPFDDNPQE